MCYLRLHRTASGGAKRFRPPLALPTHLESSACKNECKGSAAAALGHRGGQGAIPDRIRAAIRAVRERQIFDEAAPARERSSPELIPRSTGPIPVLRLQCGRAAARFYAINPCATALASGYLVRSRRYRTENKRFHLWHQRLVLDLCGCGGIGRRA
jgi:hypothetical protein